MSEKRDALIAEAASLGIEREKAERLCDAFFAYADERTRRQGDRLADKIQDHMKAALENRNPLVFKVDGKEIARVVEQGRRNDRRR